MGTCGILGGGASLSLFPAPLPPPATNPTHARELEKGEAPPPKMQ